MINLVLTIPCMICLNFLFNFLFIALLFLLHFTPDQEALLFLLLFLMMTYFLHNLFRALPKLKYIFFSMFPTFKLF